ncbi:MAG: PHP domain-containing protein [Halobacteriaceae archaeon]
MTYADLHVHTTASDGTLTLAEVPEAARGGGLSVVAVTDHDRVHPGLDAPVVEREGVTVVRGVELRVDADDQRLDLLGYAVEETDALAETLGALQRDRRERAARIVDCVEDRLGVTLDVSLADGVGRPHVARAVVAHPETDYDDVGAVFADLIAEDAPCYVARDVPTFARGAAVLGEAAEVVSLAHPLRYADPAAALALAGALDAVERAYPYGRAVDLSPVDAAAAAHDLLVTGGSDAHGTDLGAAGLGRAAYERLGLEP